jgi:hypothetical protein
MIENDVKSANAVIRMTMFYDMLDNPIPPLTASNGINIAKNLLNARTLD